MSFSFLEPPYEYQVGGCLGIRSPTYVERQADIELYNGLQAGEFCYVLNARQVGKSSLRVRTMHRLRTAGFRCASIDMTSIGSKTITPHQWYKGIIFELWQGFELESLIPFQTWWKTQTELPPLQQFHHFLKDVLLANHPNQNVYIFIDEIDSILGLEFPTDDFFALIRFCYNQRAENPIYHRITFALFGVATPSGLIRDRRRTPFNIGKAIDLQGIHLEEAQPLICGLATCFQNPEAILAEILGWTQGQPFLTQKLCALVVEKVTQSGGATFAPMTRTDDRRYSVPSPAQFVDRIVQTHILHNWQMQDEPEHLRTIHDRIMSDEQRAGRLLGLYQQVLEQGKLFVDDSTDQIELLLSGLVVRQGNQLQVRNRIYAAVFDLEYVEHQLFNLRPYSEAFRVWVASQFQDESRLLRGQALLDAQSWALGKRLSDLDYQFLSASEILDRREAYRALEADRAQQVEARLALERRTSQRQKFWLTAISIVLVLAVTSGSVAINRNQKLLRSELQANILFSEALFASHQQLDALVVSLRSWKQLQSLKNLNSKTVFQADQSLRQTVYRAIEQNRFVGAGIAPSVAFSPDGTLIAAPTGENDFTLWRQDGTLLKTFTGHQGWVRSVVFSPDGQALASASFDATVKLWHRDGRLLRTLEGHQEGVLSVAFSPDGRLLASAGFDKTIKLWQRDGRLLHTLEGHQARIESVAFSPDGRLFASISHDGTVKLWTLDGTLLNTLVAHPEGGMAVTFSSGGETLASAGRDGVIKLWRQDGSLIRSWDAHEDHVQAIAFSPDGSQIASANRDSTVKLWRTNGTLLYTLEGHKDEVWGVAFSPDGTQVASASRDTTIRIWRLNQKLMETFRGHQSVVVTVDISPDGKHIVSSSDDNTIKVWDREGNVLHSLVGHEDLIIGVTFSPDGSQIASASWDGTVKLWNLQGGLLQTLNVDQKQAWGVAFSPDGQYLATSGKDQTVKLWRIDGTLVRTLRGHRDIVWPVAFSPDGQTIASGSWDTTIKLWNLDGTLRQTISGHHKAISALTFSPDGQLLASASHDHLIKLWDQQGNWIKDLKGHQEPVKGLSFSPDGQRLASASWDKTIGIWNRQGQLLGKLNGQNGAIWSVAFGADSQTLASASSDRTIVLWNLQQVLDIQTVWQHGCNWIQNYLRTSPEVKAADRHLCD
ncbi:MAG: AAA-like domain-containing protein [Elainellaceae cyanobacterium]